MPDYSDFTRGYEFEEVSSGAHASEYNGNGTLPNFNSITAGQASLTGFGNSRGPIRATGHAAPAWFTEPTLSDAGFDIRGDVDMAFSCWLRIPDNSDGAPVLFSIHDPTTENGQAFQIYAYHSTIGQGGPGFIMWDGVTIFTGSVMFPASNNPAPVNNAFYYIGASRDKTANEIRLFYGRAAGESYYHTQADVAAGFGYSGVGLGPDEGVTVGRWDGLAQDAVIDRVDQLLFWNGRSLAQADFENIWNNHSGVATADLNIPDSGVPYYKFYYDERRRR
jgi:hypothetical protein